MIIEAILETISPLIGRVIGFLLLEVFVHMIVYSAGFVFLKIITLGKYPEEFISSNSDLHREVYVYLMGWLICISLIIIWLI